MPPGWRLPASMGRTSQMWLHHGAAGRPTLATLQSYHRYHQSLSWAMIGYSWAVTGDGTIYEGRGWGRAGAHTLTWNTRSHAIVLVGDWSSATVPQPMVDACATIMRHGIRVGALTPDVRIGGHREASGNSTTCPGGGGMRALPRIRNAMASGRPQPAPPNESWYEMATQRDLERALRAVLRDDAGDAVWGHRIGHGADKRASTLLSRLQGGGIDDVLAAVGNVPARVAGTVDVDRPDPSGWLWVADSDVDEGIARAAAALTGGQYRRWAGEPVRGSHVVIVGALGRLPVEQVAPGADDPVILQGESREGTAEAVAAWIAGGHDAG